MYVFSETYILIQVLGHSRLIRTTNHCKEYTSYVLLNQSLPLHCYLRIPLFHHTLVFVSNLTFPLSLSVFLFLSDHPRGTDQNFYLLLQYSVFCVHRSSSTFLVPLSKMGSPRPSHRDERRTKIGRFSVKSEDSKSWYFPIVTQQNGISSTIKQGLRYPLTMCRKICTSLKEKKRSVPPNPHLYINVTPSCQCFHYFLLHFIHSVVRYKPC